MAVVGWFLCERLCVCARSPPHHLYISTPSMVRHDICWHNYAVERGLVVGFCAQPHYCYRPSIQQPGLNVPHRIWSLLNRIRTGQGPCHANLHKSGLAQSPSCDCGQRQIVNHVVDNVPVNKIWRWTESTPRSGWRRSRMAGICSFCSTRERMT